MSVFLPFTFIIASPLAVFFGIKAIKQVKENSVIFGGRDMAIAGIIMGAFMMTVVCLGIAGAIFLPDDVKQVIEGFFSSAG